MESLLSPAFDRVSSKDPRRIYRGLRQVEGLLAQICLSQVPSVRSRAGADAVAGPLEMLCADPVFVEFYRLQESFQWNVPSRLIECMERLLSMKSSPEVDRLIVSNLSILHGTLLLHPPSRSLFAREGYMTMMLDLLDPSNGSEIVSTALTLLVAAMLDCARCARAFEAADGLQTVTSLFRSDSIGQPVKMRVLDFLNFYLLPEAPSSRPSTSQSMASETSQAPRHSSVKTMLSTSSDGDATLKRSATEKRRLLGRYMHDVDRLAEDLARMAPFAVV